MPDRSQTCPYENASGWNVNIPQPFSVVLPKPLQNGLIPPPHRTKSGYTQPNLTIQGLLTYA